MQQIIFAANHCHANGIIHRDIKPENIMVTSQNKIKLIDFGLSKACQDSNAHLFEKAGTPYYMAPEIF